ncbi:MAG TPA: type 1 glutamine amidotransferase [Anaerolineales bacterium]|nr:type 1 glutamine amidotransferase [Anaerolineales bacterium]
MSQPRILLLQTRAPDDPVIPEEIRIFARNAGVPKENIVPHNLLDGAPALERARRLDAVMIGGSGAYFVSQANLPDFQGILAFLVELVESGLPVFASCFGFQLIVQAFGGEVEFMPEKMELGTYALQLTEAGRADELLGTLPSTFHAHLGHKDQATRLPPTFSHLAFSELSPFQAIRFPKKPVWATQFHPEVTREENLGRFKRYIHLYAATIDPEDLRATLARFQPAPETERLIPRFMQLVFS